MRTTPELFLVIFEYWSLAPLSYLSLILRIALFDCMPCSLAFLLHLVLIKLSCYNILATSFVIRSYLLITLRLQYSVYRLDSVR